MCCYPAYIALHEFQTQSAFFATSSLLSSLNHPHSTCISCKLHLFSPHMSFHNPSSLSLLLSKPFLLSPIQFLHNLIFHSLHWVVDLPVKNWYQLLSYHSLNSSLSPLAAEQIFLDHIFHAQCFDSVPTEQSHCNVIQSNFLNNPQEFVRHLLDSVLDCNATVPQLQSKASKWQSVSEWKKVPKPTKYMSKNYEKISVNRSHI